MKAFLFNKFKLGSQKDKEKDGQKEKVPQLGPLPDWPPPPLITATPTSVKSFKPLPELSSRQLPPIGRPSSLELAEPPTTPSSSTTPTQPNYPTLPSPKPAEPDAVPSTRTPVSQPPEPMTSRSVSKATTFTSTTAITVDVQNKKVAFISPSTTPTAERPLRSPTPTNDLPPPMKKVPSNRSGRVSTTGPASSRTDLSVKSGKLPAIRPTTSSPYPNKVFADNASVQQTVRSSTPYSQSNSSRILSPASWSEHTEVDLVANLGSRERTRQEVLLEIVSSEERYVVELAKMKETFIDPLLHPFSATSTSPLSATPHPGTSLGDFKDYDEYLRTRPSESLERLPIASRFLASPVAGRSATPAPPPAKREETPHPEISDDDVDDDMARGYASKQSAKHNHPRSPYNTTANRSGRNGEVPFPSSHHSLPPPPRGTNPADSAQSLGRQSFIADSGVSTKGTIQTQGTRVLRKTLKGSSLEPVAVLGAIPPRQLPEDLRVCLEVIENDLLEGHVRLSEALKKRYEEQYPLVRSLADVFVSSSHILTGYAKYVLHLEKALEQVDNAMKYASSAGRKPSKKQENDQFLKIGAYLQRLEENAAERGETGLAISLSKPFQRLLKYPLMFQNLLYHTDPSTFEYESTLQMVAEVETIVRSIEDEKIQKEERDKTRDVLGRIDGLDKVKQLAVPKPSRVLVEERMVVLTGPSGSGTPPPGVNGAKVRGKASFKRLSDVLQPGFSGVGGKKDLWLVVFNDVVLRCQRTGTTSLPIGGAPYGRTNSMPEMQGKAKFGTTGRRNTQAKPRNLYKFLKIETWDIGNVVKPREGVVAMDEVVRSRTLHASVQPRIMPLPDDDEDEEVGDSDDSDRKSKMSFSYWGADKITLQKPVTSKPRQPTPTQNGARKTPTPGVTYNRESSANAKFGTRLLSEPAVAPPRPSSRRHGAMTPGRRPAMDDNNVVKATVTRPAWNENPRSTSTPIPKRQRNTSKPNAVVATRTPNNNSTTRLSSPSEDSGVGMYRQVLANDPSLAG